MLKLCELNQLSDNQSKGFKLEGQNLFAVKKDGNIYVYRNLCPHRGVSLEWQPDDFLDPDKLFIQCSTHTALFRIENGLCIQGPCLGDSLEAVEFTVKKDSIWVDL